MESRLRVILIEGRLPRPEAQVTLREGFRFLGRADLYYPQARLCIEYDGSTHQESLEADDLRQNRLVSAGYRLLRYTASEVYSHPDRIVAEVRTLLKARSRTPKTRVSTCSPGDLTSKRASRWFLAPAQNPSDSVSKVSVPARRLANDRNPVWATIRCDGRTLRPRTVQPRSSSSTVSSRP